MVNGNFDVISFLIVVSDNFSMIGCSLLASVLLSLYNSVLLTVVIGTYLMVVVSGFLVDCVVFC